jgi:hypothetical protein
VSTVVVSPGPASPVLSTYSVMKTPNLQSPGPSALVVENTETQENVLW